MRRRLTRWLRREPAPPGRHVRTAAPVAVTGAGGALVTAAVEPFLVAEAAAHPGPAARPPVEPAVDLSPDGPTAVTAGDVGTVTEPMPAVAAVGPAAQLVGTPEPALDAPAPEAVPEPTVALGFSDGGVLELAPDDPRLAGFQDAAAAVLGHDRT